MDCWQTPLELYDGLHITLGHTFNGARPMIIRPIQTSLCFGAFICGHRTLLDKYRLERTFGPDHDVLYQTK